MRAAKLIKAVFLVTIVRKAELRHRIVAALPLGGALRQRVREKDTLAIGIVSGPHNFLEAVGMFGNGVRPLLHLLAVNQAIPAIEAYSLRTQNAAAQSPRARRV